MRDGPARGGTRGGKDQFNWEDVKSDKDREYYLGHSVKASVGRWQKGKDLLWYTRGKEGEDAAAAARAEIAAVKAAEERAMAEALGLKPKAEQTNMGLDAREMDALLRKRERGDEDDGARTRGVGVPGTSGGGGVERETMPGVGIDGMDAGREPRGAHAESLSRRDAERLIEKARRRQKKDAKKEAKRLKKDAKKARKEERQRRDTEHRRSRPSYDRGRGQRDLSRSRSRSRSRDSRSSDSDSRSRSRRRD